MFPSNSERTTMAGGEVLNIVIFLTVLLMNGIVYLITLEKQIVLELLKGML